MNISRTVVLSLLLLLPNTCFAGMPSPLPDNWNFAPHLTEITIARLQSISFFLFGIVCSTLVIRFLWNVIAADSQWLPRISLVRAFAMVMLWGSLFVIVLTMISGARELLTPGAWKKNGATYTLEPAENARSEK